MTNTSCRPSLEAVEAAEARLATAAMQMAGLAFDLDDVEYLDALATEAADLRRRFTA